MGGGAQNFPCTIETDRPFHGKLAENVLTGIKTFIRIQGPGRLNFQGMMVWGGLCRDGTSHLWSSAPGSPLIRAPPPPPRPPVSPSKHCYLAGMGALSPRPPHWAPWGLGGTGTPPLSRAPPRGQQGWGHGDRSCRLSGGGKGHKSGKKKFLHIFKTHVALSEVLFILTKSGGSCPHSARQMEQ